MASGFIVLTLAHGAHAQPSKNAAESDQNHSGTLAARATDPTHQPLTLKFKNTLTTHHYENSDGSDPDTGYEVDFQPVIPFELWGVNHLLRLMLPFQVEGDGSRGLEDVEVVDVLVFKTSVGRVAAGVTTNLSAREKDVSGHFSAGPAVGYSNKVTSFLKLGFIMQNWFGDDIANSELQPILSLFSDSGWSLSTGEMKLSYDWEDTEFTRIPIQLEIGKVLPIADRSIRVSAGMEYNFADNAGAERFQIKMNVELLIPDSFSGAKS